MKNSQTGNQIRNNRIPIARSGYPFILASASATVVFVFLGFGVTAALGAAATVFIVFFFRDPEREVPRDPGAVVAPADGRVVSVETVSESPFSQGSCRKIGIFMSVFNVHVNRMPYAGCIKAVRYSKGSFLAADRERASLINEQNAILLEVEPAHRITVVQVAGLIARRIVCKVRENEAVSKGQRFGLIRFGSRVDLYLPEAVPLRVCAGDRVQAGVSIMGYLK